MKEMNHDDSHVRDVHILWSKTRGPEGEALRERKKRRDSRREARGRVQLLGEAGRKEGKGGSEGETRGKGGGGERGKYWNGAARERGARGGSEKGGKSDTQNTHSHSITLILTHALEAYRATFRVRRL